MVSSHPPVAVALVPFAPVLGDVAANAAAIINLLQQEKKNGTDLVVFPELSLSGYFVRDLYQQPAFLAAQEQALQTIVAASRDLPACLLGVARLATAQQPPATTLTPQTNNRTPLSERSTVQDPILTSAKRPLFGLTNSLVLIDKGAIVAQRDKYNLPNYDVFDEARYFTPADSTSDDFGRPIYWRGINWGAMICEDLWQTTVPALLARGGDKRDHKKDIAADITTKGAKKNNGADIFVVINASPFEKNKIAAREQLVRRVAHQFGRPLLYTNLYGGFDELVMDGHSIIADRRGDIMHSGCFDWSTIYINITPPHEAVDGHDGAGLSLSKWAGKNQPNQLAASTPPSTVGVNPYAQQCYEAIKIALTSYMQRNGFHKVIIGVSGGVDSGLTLALASDILGPQNILAYFMPTRYSSPSSRDDAAAVCHHCGVTLETIDIDPLYALFLQTLAIEEQAGGKVPITAQNIQSRIRGLVLMARANDSGALLLATGNKSELAVGYSTLYGDSCGGFNLLKDLYKKDVYALAAWFNQQRGQKIPANIITKAPTAELSPNQKDSDSLPPYPQLDPLLEKMIEGHHQEKDDHDLSRRVNDLIHRAEHKRNQSAPGPKLSSRAFGTGWRMAISGQYKG